MTNWSLIEATWRHWKSPALSWWGRLTEAEWEDVNGRREKLLDLLCLKYGWTKEQAEVEIEGRFAEQPDSAA